MWRHPERSWHGERWRRGWGATVGASAAWGRTQEFERNRAGGSLLPELTFLWLVVESKPQGPGK